jgi:hypothetical protein
MVLEQEGDGKGAVQPRQDRRNGIRWRCALLDLARHQMCDHFTVGFRQEGSPVRDQLVTKRLEVLYDSIVYQRHRARDVRMCIIDRRRAMRRPAGVGDADVSV